MIHSYIKYNFDCYSYPKTIGKNMLMIQASSNPTTGQTHYMISIYFLI